MKHATYKRALALLAGTTLATAGLVATAGTAHAAVTYSVGYPGSACGNAADFATITEAVAIAQTGDTINVCAGTFRESVTVTTPGLTFTGAAAGQDGRLPRGGEVKTIITSTSGAAFNLGGTADDTTIDGFVLQNSDANGVNAFSGSSGLTFVNNIVQKNNNGVFFANADEDNPTVFMNNRFFDNNRNKATLGGDSGSGIFICCGDADGTQITDNEFGKHTETAINFAGNGGDRSEDLVVSDNKSAGDSTFVVATNSSGAVINRNVVRAKEGHGTGILDFGANDGLRITSNAVSATGSFRSTGISVNNFGGVPSSGTTVTNNAVQGYNFLIRVGGGDTGVYVANNTVKNPGIAGLRVDDAITKRVLFSHNTVTATTATPNSAEACQDASTGNKTAGTANTWQRNTGGSLTSSPQGICSTNVIAVN